MFFGEICFKVISKITVEIILISYLLNQSLYLIEKLLIAHKALKHIMHIVDVQARDNGLVYHTYSYRTFVIFISTRLLFIGLHLIVYHILVFLD